VVDYDYVQAVAAEVRKEMNVSKTGKLGIQDFIDQFQELDAVLIPVFWGERKQHGNAMHAYLPDSMTTWIWLNLDSRMHDFMFWMAHELGHAYSPDLEGDAAEDFADLFAQCLLFPDAATKKMYRQLFQISTAQQRWSTIAAEAQRRLISPYSIIKAIESYAKHNELSEIKFGNFGSQLTRFNKSIKTVAEFLFKGEQPEPAEYISICSKAFGTPFFNALTTLSEKDELTLPFLTKTMNVSLMDAKSICLELA
jgi:Zn-dependent peptidase ImmA (M78 family)